MTNEERIKSLSTEDLAEWLFVAIDDCTRCPIRDYCDKLRPQMPVVNCRSVWRKWLKSEVQNNDISKS